MSIYFFGLRTSFLWIAIHFFRIAICKKNDRDQRLTANELKEIIDVKVYYKICFNFYSIKFTHVFWQSLNIFLKDTRPFSANNLTKVSHSDLLKEREENYRKAMEKLQRENEEMKNKLAELSTATISVQVN